MTVLIYYAAKSRFVRVVFFTSCFFLFIVLLACSNTNDAVVYEDDRDFSHVPLGTAFYVSNDGNDRNEGTSESTAWRTLQYAANKVPAGSTVYVLGGVYNQKLKITRSGSASAGPITFESYPEGSAILDGKGLSSRNDEGMVEIEDASYVVIKGFEIRNYKTTKRKQVPMGIFVHGAGTNIEIRNNYIHDIQNKAKLLFNLSGRDAHGIAIYGTEAPEALSNLVIEGNTLNHLILGSSEALVINGNVDTFSITNNKVHDNDNIGIDVIGFEGTSPDEAFDQARNGVISGNSVYNITSSHNPSYGRKLPNDSYAAGGIYIDGGKDMIIERNYSFNNDIGIEIASENKGKAASGIVVRSNVIYSNNYTGIAMGGYDEERGSTLNCIIVNNTLYKNDIKDYGGGQLLLQYNIRNNIIINNIMVASSSGLFVVNEYTENSGNTVDYNLYGTTNDSKYTVWGWKDVTYPDFASYTKGTGNDSHSLFEDPSFESASGNHFQLKATSPAINAGLEDAVILDTYDIDGNIRIYDGYVDLGALEAIPK